jgi:prolyl-tRNA synthetase
VYTHAIEAMMRDRRALQAGTSHMLGQNFARAADITFLDRDNQRKHPWGTSWGFSTRMVGATIMAHGDDHGLVLPPNVAPLQVVVVPIFRSEEERAAVAGAVERLERAVEGVATASGPLRLKVDWREETPGFKFNHWELRGVPLRLEIGPRDVAAGQGVLVRRFDRVKEAIPLARLAGELPQRLATYQSDVLQRARDFQQQHTHRVDTLAEMGEVLEAGGGFLLAPWCGSAECEKAVSAENGATIRVIPFDSPDEAGRCVADGAPSERRVLFARAY